MTATRISLGGRTIDEIHEQAILLWYDIKQRDPDQNPSGTIYWTLTDEVWPSDVPRVTTAIDLCDVLRGRFGYPHLTTDERRSLNAKAVCICAQHDARKSPIMLFRYMMWATRAGYLLGFVSLIRSGFSWWVAGLMFAAWSCFGTTRMSAQARTKMKTPEWRLPVNGLLHVIALLGLYVASLLHLLRV